jgi:uncharacterized DUF497 family protein
MEIQFDPAKDATNQQKHGVALSEAGRLDWDALVDVIDDRFDYGEERIIGYGEIDGRLYCCVYVEIDDETVRVISLRKANKREVARYGQPQESDDAE